MLTRTLVVVWLLAGHGALAQELPRVTPEQLGLSSQRLDHIATLVEDAVARNEVAGAVTLVARLGRVGHLEAVGWRDIERQAPMETDTLFRIASMTKAVTSVAVMQLYERGSLLLSDPVSRYLPAFAEMRVQREEAGADAEAVLEPVQRPITIRHLLTHTSGLSYRFLAPPALSPYYVALSVRWSSGSRRCHWFTVLATGSHTASGSTSLVESSKWSPIKHWRSISQWRSSSHLE